MSKQTGGGDDMGDEEWKETKKGSQERKESQS